MSSASDQRPVTARTDRRVLYRQVLTVPPTTWDFLSQAARRQPSPRDDPKFLKDWAGVSVFDTYRAARRNGRSWKWRHGEYIAVLVFPDDAPFTFAGPEHRGHWMIYDIDGNMLMEDAAQFLLDNYVAKLVHGPTVESFTL